MGLSSYLVPRTSLLILLVVLATSAGAVPRVEVTVDGVAGEIRDTVLANLSLQRERNHPLLSESRIARLHGRAPQEIAVALRPFGYYAATVSGELTHEGERWRARYTVDPGRPVRITAVEITIEGAGAKDPVLARWRDEFPLAKGDILLDQVYEDAKETLLRLGRERGYMQGELTEHQVQVNAGQYSARILLRYVTGERLRFGAVTYSQVPLRDSLLTRYAGFYPGDYYDAEQLYQLHRDLADSDYFERVEVVPHPEEAVEGRVPVDVGLQMRKRDRYTMGLGYGTDTGPRASLGYERRWLNSYGHRFSSDAVVSDVRKSIVADYRIPLDNPTTDYLGFTGSRVREKTEAETVSDTSTVGVSITTLLGRWQRTVSLNYLEENFEVGEITERSTMLYPGVLVQRLETDDRFFPTRGWRLTGEFRMAAEDYWSATGLVQGRLAGKAVIPLWGGRFIPRFDLGSSYVSKFDQLPVSLRFFAGGDQSVRGFAYKSLGPEDANGDVEGGTNLLVASTEYDYYFGKRFGVAAFTDMGNAFNSFDDYELHQGAGLGLRWRMLFGVVRLDVASAVSEEGKPVRLHLTIGPDL